MDAKLRVRMPKEAWFDRDLSWLEFNRRVLAEAIDERVPLLERIKFLAIFTSNLDEFFMKRVGAMRTRAYASGNLAVVEEFNAHIHRLRDALQPLLLRRAECFAELRQRLARHGVKLAAWGELSPVQCRRRANISSVTSRPRSRR